MKLKLQKRSDNKKSTIKRMRIEGNIPAVVYGAGKENELGFISSADFGEIQRSLPKGRLSTQIFVLESDKGATKAILKDIQYNLTTYDIIHLDFVALQDEHLVNVNVPIVAHGVADCAGVKQGGVLRQIIRHLKVKCLPKDIPQKLDVDVANLPLLEAIRLREIALPEGVSPQGRMDEIAFVVAKR